MGMEDLAVKGYSAADSSLLCQFVDSVDSAAASGAEPREVEAVVLQSLSVTVDCLGLAAEFESD